ncbi:MAG: ABC transporter substrate-binding protein [Methanospirillum sp.]|uniref:ABC transporter substrate-binding protein n=1 Tax=Methanospirillum sp. TaxID=45200 RepID=UPI00236AF52C|nr:ABC transporter substrate-binding protein [Methanospirillum sp.]MDD1729798.1 ABC transporter substrate-binding protein [Methanospirillum sp.]
MVGTGPCLADDTQTIVDITGNQVTLPVNITRAVNIDPFAAQFLYVIGADDRLIATQHGPSDAEKLKKYTPYLASLPSAGHKDDLNKEEVVALKPEVVISSIDYVNANEVSKQLGIPFVILDFESPENLTRSYQIMGQMFGKEREADEFISYYNGKMNQVRTDLAAVTSDTVKKVYYGQRKATQTLGDNYYEARIATIAGGDNVAEGVKGGDNVVSMDQIYTWNPDVIVLLPYCAQSVDDILADPAWQALPAVQKKKVYRMPKFLMTWEMPVPESVLATMWLANVLYPGYVNYDLTQEIKEFYQKYYRINLSDNEILSILSDSAPIILTGMS